MKDSVDEKLAVALFDVPVPPGLAERLLAGLAAEPNRPVEELPVAKDPLAVSRSSSFVPRFSGRRWFLAGSGLAAVAAGLLIAVWLGLDRGEGLSEQFVLDEAIRSLDAGVGQPGRLLAEQPGPGDYPFSLAVVQVRGAKWRPLRGDSFLGRRGVVYDLPGPAGTSAALYVVGSGTSAGFADAPALHPFTTAGCCASAWQQNGLLYVLVVQGDPATYRAFLNRPHGPVA